MEQQKDERWKFTMFCAVLGFALALGWTVKNYRSAGVLSWYTLVVALPGLFVGIIFLRRALKERKAAMERDKSETEQ